jgi:DNA polymerase III delta prime subunit
MLSRFSQHINNSPGGSAWLFLGAPREEVFTRACEVMCLSMGVTDEVFRSHPDVQIVRAPEEKTAAGRQRVLGVEDIRDVLERLSLTSFSGKKYVFLPDADLLSEPAQNALLKIIEDPVGEMIACFFTEDLSRIVAPLRSRLSLVALPPLARSVWNGEAENSPEVFYGVDVAARLALVERLVKEGKGDVGLILDWLVVLQSIASEQGNGPLFLVAVSAWDGIRGQGNIHAHLTRVALS